jgi:hypothetical protein
MRHRPTMLRAVSEQRCTDSGRGYADYEDGWFCNCFRVLISMNYPVALAPHTVSRVHLFPSTSSITCCNSS